MVACAHIDAHIYVPFGKRGEICDPVDGGAENPDPRDEWKRTKAPPRISDEIESISEEIDQGSRRRHPRMVRAQRAGKKRQKSGQVTQSWPFKGNTLERRGRAERELAHISQAHLHTQTKPESTGRLKRGAPSGRWGRIDTPQERSTGPDEM